MSCKKYKLPKYISDAIILHLKACSTTARRALLSMNEAIEMIQKMYTPEQSKGAMKSYKKSANYWQNVISAYDFAIHRAMQNVSWPDLIINMSDDEMLERNIDMRLREELSYNASSPYQQAEPEDCKPDFDITEHELGGES